MVLLPDPIVILRHTGLCLSTASGPLIENGNINGLVVVDANIPFPLLNKPFFVMVIPFTSQRKMGACHHSLDSDV